MQLILHVTVIHLTRDAIRNVPPRITRAGQLGVTNTSLHHDHFNFDVDEMIHFEPILAELRNRVVGDGTGSMWPHHIKGSGVHTKALQFEATYLLTNSMQDQLQQWLAKSPQFDGETRRCHRALANHFETKVQLSSKKSLSQPLILPHRDDVNDADISIVLGITPRSDFRGAFLYISTNDKGNVWMEKPEVPSRKGVTRVDVCNGVCVILRNKVEHFVSALQSGSRGSIVFHMSKQ